MSEPSSRLGVSRIALGYKHSLTVWAVIVVMIPLFVA
jgi:hypothetical protein